jgi:hypothetical protein
MKRISFLLFTLLFTVMLYATETPIVLTEDPVSPGPHPMSLTNYPVSATISETNLSVYFDSYIGNATITVYDANDNVVSQETVDTYSTSEVFIAADAWESGNYTIKISYVTATLSGVFLVE